LSQRLLGFDYGRKRIGVASGQLVTGTASALETVRVFRQGPDWQRISELVAQWQPQRMVLGISRHADGTDSHLTPLIREFAAELTERYGCDVETIDEYLSSAEARMLLEEGGAATEGDHLDALAAQLILQSWIDQQSRRTS
jgi:putative holliday junction resolvase